MKLALVAAAVMWLALAAGCGEDEAPTELPAGGSCRASLAECERQIEEAMGGAILWPTVPWRFLGAYADETASGPIATLEFEPSEGVLLQLLITQASEIAPVGEPRSTPGGRSYVVTRHPDGSLARVLFRADPWDYQVIGGIGTPRPAVADETLGLLVESLK